MLTRPCSIKGKEWELSAGRKLLLVKSSVVGCRDFLRPLRRTLLFCKFFRLVKLNRMVNEFVLDSCYLLTVRFELLSIHPLHTAPSHSPQLFGRQVTKSCKTCRLFRAWQPVQGWRWPHLHQPTIAPTCSRDRRGNSIPARGGGLVCSL